MLEYKISATSKVGGSAKATANQLEISFDASAGRDNILPNPAELLLTSLAACILKNVERYSEILHYPYKSAKVTIIGKRSDNPPAMTHIEYNLQIETDIDEKKLANWRKNILKFGTISNTLAKSVELKGTINFLT